MSSLQKYIVVDDLLGMQAGAARRGEADEAARRSAAEKLSDGLVQTAELTLREARAIENSPRLIAAPIMPTRLLNGLARDDAGVWRPSQGVPVAEPGSGAMLTSWGIDAVGAAADGGDGELATVAMLDTGIDRSHAAFAGITNLSENDFTGEGNGDREGHGTHCAGTIFGRDCHGHQIGVARKVNTVFIGKVLDSRGHGTSDALLQGLKWALDRHADVISVSIGFDFPGMVDRLVSSQHMPISLATSQALVAYRQNLRALDAIMTVARAQAGTEAGSVILAATGNESHAEVDPRFRVAASLPAAAQDAIGVAAIERSGDRHRIADFSNGFPIISAPGVDIISAGLGGGLVQMSGTSMACPHAAGVAALWWDHLRRSDKETSARRVASFLSTSARTDVFHEAFGRAEFGDGIATSPHFRP